MADEDDKFRQGIAAAGTPPDDDGDDDGDDDDGDDDVGDGDDGAGDDNIPNHSGTLRLLHQDHRHNQNHPPNQTNGFLFSTSS